MALYTCLFIEQRVFQSDPDHDEDWHHTAGALKEKVTMTISHAGEPPRPYHVPLEYTQQEWRNVLTILSKQSERRGAHFDNDFKYQFGLSQIAEDLREELSDALTEGEDTPTDFPDLPDGWEWWSGNTSSGHYTRWFGTEEAEDGYEGEMYWDEGHDHKVLIYPVIGIREDGDPDVSEYPDASASFDTEQEAANAVPDLIEQLEEDDD